jgi:hypothetical protein
MALREFTDARGNPWRVWDTRPTTGNVRPHLTEGWLTFEHEGTRKRVAPIPDGWTELPGDELRLLCANARPERSRRRAAE